MLVRESAVIESIEPREGREGTIVTLKGSGFESHIRNNCTVVGGMAACARAQEGSTPTELKIKIGPVARATSGDILMWPGIGADLYAEEIDFGHARLDFSEAAVFQNGAPVVAAGVDFTLTEESPNTYAGALEASAASSAALGGHEKGAVMRACFPRDFELPENPVVDICLVLKEPTLAIDVTAAISGHDTREEALDAVAKAIEGTAQLMGKEVHADVTRRETGELELYVTQPNLLSGMLIVHFGSAS